MTDGRLPQLGERLPRLADPVVTGSGGRRQSPASVFATRRELLGLLAVGFSGLGGCAGARPDPLAGADPEPPSTLLDAWRAHGGESPGLLALGEIHDNAHQHRLRARWLRRLFEQGGPFCVAMEQFDAVDQRKLDDAVGAIGTADPRAVAQAGGFNFKGWDWALYEPVVAFALRLRLPLIAANLSAAETARIARGQAQPLPASPPPGWGPSDETAQQRSIADGHCGLLPVSVVPMMARAQRARDATMARAIVEASRVHRLPVVLLAGNGHVRRDLGVPRHLDAAGHRGPTLCVGFVESEAAEPATAPAASTDGRAPAASPGLARDASGVYDWRVVTAAQPRPDPCEALRKRPASGGSALINRPGPVGQQ